VSFGFASKQQLAYALVAQLPWWKRVEACLVRPQGEFPFEQVLDHPQMSGLQMKAWFLRMVANLPLARAQPGQREGARPSPALHSLREGARPSVWLSWQALCREPARVQSVQHGR
jgi:hypothetical protein